MATVNKKNLAITLAGIIGISSTSGNVPEEYTNFLAMQRLELSCMNSYDLIKSCGTKHFADMALQSNNFFEYAINKINPRTGEFVTGSEPFSFAKIYTQNVQYEGIDGLRLMQIRLVDITPSFENSYDFDDMVFISDSSAAVAKSCMTYFTPDKFTNLKFNLVNYCQTKDGSTPSNFFDRSVDGKTDLLLSEISVTINPNSLL